MVSLTYEIVAYNTGIQHDLIVGASIFDSNWNFVIIKFHATQVSNAGEI